jgi:hypothetical protein
VATIEWLRELPKAGPLPQLWHTFAIAMEDGSRIEIPPQLNGPAGSGQGGYCCGIFAAPVGNPAEVTLRSPVPLAKSLTVSRQDGDSFLIHDGDRLVAEARSAAPRVEVPEPIAIEEAERARQRFPGPSEEAFTRCFVCGTARDDSQRVWAGPVEGRRLVATPWTPSDEWLGEGGRVRPEFVWAVLDCPASFAPLVDSTDFIVMLGRLTVEVRAATPMGEPHLIIAWPIGRDGRKHRTAAALLSAEGDVRAVAEAVLIELDALPGAARTS